MRAAFLGYRYWLDAPGNDVMWFWSENHVLCFHTAQLIAGTLFPDDIFPSHGKTGRDMAAEAEARLIRWFDAIDDDGLCEWNSAAYYPIDFLGLFTLHDMAPALRDRVRKVLDRIFVMTGLHTTGGVPAGSQGRAYEKEMLAGPATELGSVAAIAFGGDFRPGLDRAATLFCLSDYEPPDATPPVSRAGPAHHADGALHPRARASGQTDALEIAGCATLYGHRSDDRPAWPSGACDRRPVRGPSDGAALDQPSG